MKKIIILSTLLLSVTNTSATNNFYASVGGGWTIPSRDSSTKSDSSYAIYGPTTAPSGRSIFNLPNVDWQNKYNNGFNLNAAVGYQIFHQWRTDIEFIYQRFKREVSGSYDFIELDAVSTAVIDSENNISMDPSSGYANVYSLLTNGYYDFHIKNSKWSPLIGLGFGVAWMQSSVAAADSSFVSPFGITTRTLESAPKITGTAFAGQLKLGMAYDWRKTVAVILQYRLFVTSQFIAEQSSIITNPNAGSAARTFTVSQQKIRGLVTNNFEVAVRFKLG